jgi:mono/diheme cytochrome c family protein
MRRFALVIGGLIAAGVALADFVPAVRADDSAPAAPVTPATVKRGEYLAHAADCAACHMGTDKKLSGGRAFTTPFGRIYASNITPDKTQGVGDYTDDEWVAALQRGVGRGGKHLYPAMPYTNYTLMSREDALAIKAYILSQPGSAAATPPNSLSFPFDIRFLMVFWNVLNNPDKRFVPDTTHDAVWNRGAYLAEALGHCQQCHTPRNFMQGLKTSQAYAGAVQQGWKAYNITSDAKSGIGDWSAPDLATYLTTGHATGHGAASGPMAEAVGYSLRYLTPEDAAALASYVKSIPAITTETAGSATQIAENETGKKVFEGACASCHRLDGTGNQSPYAALAGSPSVTDPTATNLLQMVLLGGHIDSQAGQAAMPGFAGGYTDGEIAALAQYTLAHFGQTEGTVTAADVAKARGGTAGKPATGA